MGLFGLNITGKRMSYKEIKYKLQAYCNTIIHRDLNYLVPDNPSYILKKSPARQYKYGSSEARDCDDAVRIFRGWLSRKKYGNVLAMDVGIWHQDIRYHALIGFWYQDRLVLGEPQTGEFDVYPNSVIKRIIL